MSNKELEVRPQEVTVSAVEVAEVQVQQYEYRFNPRTHSLEKVKVRPFVYDEAD